MSIPQTDPNDDQPGTWVNLTGDLAEFVPVGEQCSANVLAELRDEAASGVAPSQAPMTDTLTRAADFLEHYADFIRRDVMSVDIERHPYLPELEEVAAEVRSAAGAVGINGLTETDRSDLRVAANIIDRDGPSPIGVELSATLRRIASAGVTEAPAPAADETLETLIEESGGYWKEDVFCIEGDDLMNLLRAASTAGVKCMDNAERLKILHAAMDYATEAALHPHDPPGEAFDKLRVLLGLSSTDGVGASDAPKGDPRDDDAYFNGKDGWRNA